MSDCSSASVHSVEFGLIDVLIPGDLNYFTKTTLFHARNQAIQSQNGNNQPLEQHQVAIDGKPDGDLGC
jgi:hypothetical protein